MPTKDQWIFENRRLHWWCISVVQGKVLPDWYFCNQGSNIVGIKEVQQSKNFKHRSWICCCIGSFFRRDKSYCAFDRFFRDQVAKNIKVWITNIRAIISVKNRSTCERAYHFDIRYHHGMIELETQRIKRQMYSQYTLSKGSFNEYN